MDDKQNRKKIYAETLRKQEAKRREIREFRSNSTRKSHINKKPIGKTAQKILSKSNPHMNNNNKIAMRKGYIYCIVDMDNIARYIGQTVRNPVTRFNEHMNGAFDPTSSSYTTQFSQAIRNCGIDNFRLLILESGIIESDLDSKEKAYISHYNTFHGGYNGTRGGGRIKTPQTVQYIPPTSSHTSYSDSNSNKTYSISELNSSDDNCYWGCCIGVFIIFALLFIIGSII